ncbi:MAG: hypothetical protein J2P21_08100 [Chloracidobacterium sp.]|nr:hypothetical protein [Chloracidobacterium sp.]
MRDVKIRKKTLTRLPIGQAGVLYCHCRNFDSQLKVKFNGGNLSDDQASAVKMPGHHSWLPGNLKDIGLRLNLQ